MRKTAAWMRSRLALGIRGAIVPMAVAVLAPTTGVATGRSVRDVRVTEGVLNRADSTHI